MNKGGLLKFGCAGLGLAVILVGWVGFIAIRGTLNLAKSGAQAVSDAVGAGAALASPDGWEKGTRTREVVESIHLVAGEAADLASDKTRRMQETVVAVVEEGRRDPIGTAEIISSEARVAARRSLTFGTKYTVVRDGVHVSRDCDGWANVGTLAAGDFVRVHGFSGGRALLGRGWVDSTALSRSLDSLPPNLLLEVTARHKLFPVAVNINTDGELSVSLGGTVQTPLGPTELSANVTLRQHRFLVVRCGNRTQRYLLDEKWELEFPTNLAGRIGMSSDGKDFEVDLKC